MREEQAIQRLQDIVRLETVNGEEKRVADYLETLFSEYGIDTTRIEYAPERINLIAEIGEGNGPVLAFDGHMDVVATGDESAWTYPPFSATIENGRMFGRGVTDMKSGLMAAVLAMINLKTSNVKIPGKIRLMATIGEELGLLGAQQLAELGYAKDIDSLVVCEPSGESREVVLKMPLPEGLVKKEGNVEQRFIFVAHKGSLTYEVHAKGRAAHSSMPELGKNAIDSLMYYYQKQQEYFDTITTKDTILGPMTPVVTLISGGEQANSVPEFASMTTKIRTIPEVHNTTLIKELTELIETCNQQTAAELSLHILQSSFPVKSDPKAKIVGLTKMIVEDAVGESVPIIGVAGGTDASRFVEYNPDIHVVVCGPGNASAHQVDEFVYVDTYLQFIDAYEQIMRRFFE